MKTVTISFKNSRNQDETATFDVYPRSSLTPEQRRELISAGAKLISREDFADDDVARVEKQAARTAGLAIGEPFIVMQR